MSVHLIIKPPQQLSFPFAYIEKQHYLDLVAGSMGCTPVVVLAKKLYTWVLEFVDFPSEVYC